MTEPTPPIRDTHDFGPPPPQPRETLWEKLYRFFFGDDIFISYARSDAIRYVPSLAARLAAKKYICFFDQLIADPNEDLPETLKKKILRSTVFVLIGTKGAVSSSFVRKEIELFRRTRRPFIPVDVDGAVVDQQDWRDVIGMAKIHEDGARVRAGDPSPEVVNLIKDSFRYTRRTQWLRASLFAGISVIFITGAVSLLIIRAAKAEASAIKQRADSEVAALNQKVSEAEQRLQGLTAEAHRLKGEAADARYGAEKATLAAEAATTREAKAEDAMRQAQELERQSVERAAETSRREEGSRSAFLSREPGKEADALALAVKAGEASLAHGGDISTEIMDGIATSAMAADYSLPLDEVGQVLLPQISPNGEQIVGQLFSPNPEASRLVFWDSRTGKSNKSILDVGGSIGATSFSRDGKRLAAAIFKGQRQRLLVWDVTGTTARQIRTKCELERFTYQMALDSDGSHIITIGQGVNGPSIVSVCEIANGREELLIDSTAVSRVAFSPQGEPALYGNMAAPGESNLPTTVYFPRSGRKVGLKPFSDPALTDFVGFGDDGSVILILRDYEGVPNHNSIYVQSPDGEVRLFTGYRGIISSAAFVDGQALVVTSTGRAIRLADARRLPNFVALRAHVRALEFVAFSPDDQTILTIGDDGKGRLWDAQTGRLSHTLAITDEFLYEGRSSYYRPKRAAFQADGTRLVTANEKGLIQTWDVKSGHPLCSVPGRATDTNDYPFAVSFLTGGDHVLAAYSGIDSAFLYFFDSRTCTPTGKFNFDEKIGSLTFSSDGTAILTASSNPHVYRLDKPELKLWSLSSLDLRSGLPIRLSSLAIGSEAGQTLSFSFDGLRMRAALGDDMGQLWLFTGNSRVPLEKTAGDTRWILQLIVSANAGRVAALTDRGARVWDSHSGKLLLAFDCDPEAFANSPIALSPDGSKLAIAGKDHMVRIYPTSREDFLGVARRLLGK